MTDTTIPIPQPLSGGLQLIRTESPGRPPRLLHSSWTLLNKQLSFNFDVFGEKERGLYLPAEEGLLAWLGDSIRWLVSMCREPSLTCWCCWCWYCWWYWCCWVMVWPLKVPVGLTTPPPPAGKRQTARSGPSFFFRFRQPVRGYPGQTPGTVSCQDIHPAPLYTLTQYWHFTCSTEHWHHQSR